ncbi:MAG: GNAT family N-acetyltransferase [Eubacteriales bacterium]|nr:GNAT family N-acetyltransferase [Eubacteriales bacterium]
MPIEVRPLTPEKVEDFFTFFEKVAYSDHPEWGCGCYCCFFHATDRVEWERRTAEDNRIQAREMILAGDMRGLLAYDQQTPVGWCHYDLLSNLPGAAAFYPSVATDDPESAAIVCFTVAQGWRKQGVATALLTAALDDLRARGVRRVEAYPVLRDESPEHNYLGPLTLYQKMGFSIAKEVDGLALVELTL